MVSLAAAAKIAERSGFTIEDCTASDDHPVKPLVSVPATGLQRPRFSWANNNASARSAHRFASLTARRVFTSNTTCPANPLADSCSHSRAQG
jgi:hypothetical protein